MPAFDYPRYPATLPPELHGEKRRHRVCIVGAGPVGLTLALDLAQRGVECVLLEAGDSYSEGSRALCWSKRTLEILDRLGVAEAMLERGFTWNGGRVYWGGDEVYRFTLQRQGAERFPAFINLQQYLAESFLVAATEQAAGLIELRWRNRASGVALRGDGATVEVATPAGTYRLDCDWLVAADGARSPVRHALGLPFGGRVFEDHFLIADVTLEPDLPSSERRFWFEPNFHEGETALLHRQGDGMWRVDFQLGWAGVDPEAEARPERAVPRIKGMLGAERRVEVSWTSVYTFQARRLARFRHDRVLFAGDAAHQVSPFGARGGNSGVQDAENLAWKLALVLQGLAPDHLLDSYDAERGFAADENIRHTSRTTDFMTAKTPLRARMRRAVLSLAKEYPFARALVNSGRLSTATVHTGSPLNGDDEGFSAGVPVGGPLPDLNLADGGHLLQRHFGRGPGFHLLCFGAAPDALPPGLPVPVDPVAVGDGGDLADPDGRLARAFDAVDGTAYLVRPDQHVAARWRAFRPERLLPCLKRAIGCPEARP